MPTPQPWDIWLVRVPLKDCEDYRPCLILEWRSANRLLIAPLSSQYQLFRSAFHISISDADPSFPATGLKRASYVVGDELRELSLSRFKCRLGRLEGELLVRLKTWLGEEGNPHR